jgi:D-aminopeptidase
VTAIWPGGPDIWHNAVFAGFHSFNGNGEMTGTIWIEEQGLLASPVCITNTHAVGIVRDAQIAYAVKQGVDQKWHLPVTAETYDGWLSDAESFPVKAEHVFAALDSAATGPVAEGCVGGGTGMICHEFKGGIGTASRQVASAGSTYTVGALVQANYGARDLLRVDGGSLSSSQPTRRCCRSSASGWRGGRQRASPGSAASVPTVAETSSWPFPPATACRRTAS